MRLETRMLSPWAAVAVALILAPMLARADALNEKIAQAETDLATYRQNLEAARQELQSVDRTKITGDVKAEIAKTKIQRWEAEILAKQGDLDKLRQDKLKQERRPANPLDQKIAQAETDLATYQKNLDDARAELRNVDRTDITSEVKIDNAKKKMRQWEVKILAKQRDLEKLRQERPAEERQREQKPAAMKEERARRVSEGGKSKNADKGRKGSTKSKRTSLTDCQDECKDFTEATQPTREACQRICEKRNGAILDGAAVPDPHHVLEGQ